MKHQVKAFLTFFARQGAQTPGKKFFSHAFKLALCLFYAGTVTANSQELIVFTAKGIGLQPGDVVMSTAVISLEEGQSVALIAQSGKMIALEGQFHDLPVKQSEKESKQLSNTLKALIASQATSDDLGVTRDTTAIIKASAEHGWVPEAWVVDVTRGGNTCVKEGHPVVLWRAQPVAESFQLSTGDEYRANTDWPEGENKIATPVDMPIINGETYQFVLGSETVNSQLHVIPSSIKSTNVTAAWMLEMGCKAQAIAMLR